MHPSQRKSIARLSKQTISLLIIISLFLQNLVVAFATTAPAKPQAYSENVPNPKQKETVFYDYKWVEPEYKTVEVTPGKYGTRTVQKCTTVSYEVKVTIPAKRDCTKVMRDDVSNP